MSHRCINAFVFADQMYSGGCEVADDASILETHRDYFAKVDAPSVPTERATATPGEVRTVTPAKTVPAPKKASPKPAPTTGAEPKTDDKPKDAE